MRDFLEVFKGIIAEIYGPNLVIGGMVALIEHGLISSRKPSDIDVIIFQPTGRQLQALKYFEHFDQIRDRPGFIDGYGHEKIKAYKLKKGDYYMDIIISHDPTPLNLMVYKYGDAQYQVNSIKNIIDAKRSYFLNRNTDDGMQKYVRGKDAIDLIDLKNQNFNL